jgi:hypothetical protein
MVSYLQIYFSDLDSHSIRWNNSGWSIALVWKCIDTDSYQGTKQMRNVMLLYTQRSGFSEPWFQVHWSVDGWKDEFC